MVEESLATNSKVDDVQHFVTNTAAKPCTYRFGCQINQVYNGSKLAGVHIAIHEHHTGQIDLYNGSDLNNFVQINLAHQKGQIFVIELEILPPPLSTVVCDCTTHNLCMGVIIPYYNEFSGPVMASKRKIKLCK